MLIKILSLSGTVIIHKTPIATTPPFKSKPLLLNDMTSGLAKRFLTGRESLSFLHSILSLPASRLEWSR
jgi:hypothetical protein